MKTITAACAALLALAAGAVQSALAAPPLAPYQQTYALQRGVLTIGQARFELARDGADGCWRYEYKAQPEGIARLFIGQLREQTHFCIVDDVVKSSRFEYHRADKSADDFSLEFDWQSRVVRTSVGEIRELKDAMTDRLALQIVVQRWAIARDGAVGPEELSVTQVEQKKARTYRFRIVGHETVEVPAGRFETVRVERVDNPKKSVRFWLAPSRGYTLVRFEQAQDGSEKLSMQLSS